MYKNFWKKVFYIPIPPHANIEIKEQVYDESLCCQDLPGIFLVLILNPPTSEGQASSG